MKSGRIIVITGSPGTGKTTTSAIVARESDMERSVHMHTDDFYHYLSKGAIPPHLPESNVQNLIVIEAFLEAAKCYVRGGYDVIVDGIIGPWFLEPWRNIVRGGYEVHYIILKATKEETMKRAIKRSKLDKETNIELVETMWEQFHNTGVYEPNAIDTTNLSISDTVSKIKEKIESKTALLLG
ncbi:MAG: AAA family ATPase [Lachnospiraceae bacterium]|nr:AAA family ATPase [Lachnospiraceae bacterium]